MESQSTYLRALRLPQVEDGGFLEQGIRYH
jgi:hypothetical protein